MLLFLVFIVLSYLGRQNELTFVGVTSQTCPKSEFFFVIRPFLIRGPILYHVFHAVLRSRQMDWHASSQQRTYSYQGTYPSPLTPPKQKIIRPVTMETRCCQKKLEFQRYPQKDFCTARYEHKSSIFFFQTFQKKRKKYFFGRSWAKIGLRKTQPNVVLKRRDSESSTDIDRQNQRLRHEF